MVDQVGEPMRGSLDPDLDPRMVGPARLLALVEPSLREACLPLSGNPGAPRRVALFLALPEFRPGFTASDATWLRKRLLQSEALPIDLTEVHVFTRGHAAGAFALAAAISQLGRGQVGACLVAGVESYFHPDTMEWLDANRQLSGTVSRSGFFPGEGAGSCLLMTHAASRNLGQPVLGELRSVGIGQETKLIKTEDICVAEGLTAAVRESIDDLRAPGARIDGIVCDLNGERYRGEEWGFVCLRLGHLFDDPTCYLCPAECWGDMGSASLPLFAALACEASVRGYARGVRTMLWASSEGGDRGAVVLESTRTL
jgi:3-oxoacyl-[acyl-carrier-protein] synthase-1